jgi:HNH endonuclease
MTAFACLEGVRARLGRTREGPEPDRALAAAQPRREMTMVYRSMDAHSSFADLPDRDLLIEVRRLAQVERAATAALVASLAEVDARRLYLGEGCSSLFVYCTRLLHLSESAAYARIAAARAGRRFPIVLDLLVSGDVTLTTVCLLSSHLTDSNHRSVLDSASHKSKREVEQLVAAIHPRPDVASTIRVLPAQKALAAPSRFERPPAGPSVVDTQGVSVPAAPPLTAQDPPAVAVAPPAPARAAVVAALAPARYKVQFTVSRETHDKLRHAQDLLRHSVPNGDPAEIFDRALTLLVEHLERTKLASVKRPRNPGIRVTESRHIPSSVKREVWVRDGGRCTFEGTEVRCGERGFLEFHHVIPYASGGAATAENIQLRCRAHNQHEAREVLGDLVFETGAIS